MKKNKILLCFTLLVMVAMVGLSLVSMVSFLNKPNTSFEPKILTPDKWIKWGSINAVYVARGVAVADDGYLYVVGYTNANRIGDYDAYIKKFDSDFNLQWTAFWGWTGNDYGEDIAIDNEGNIIIVGASHSLYHPGAGYQIFIAKYSPSGTLIKNATRSANGFEVLWGVDVGPDNRYYTCGDIHYTGDVDDYDAVYIIWNDDLTIDVSGVWLNGAAQETDRAYDIKATVDWGFVLVGETESEGAGMYDGFIALYDWQGNLVANTTWGGAQMERFDGVVLTDASHFNAYVAAWTNTDKSGWYDATISCYNSTIDLLWTANYTDSNVHNLYFDICLSSDSYLYASGYTTVNVSTDALIVKCDTTGTILDYGLWGNSTEQDAGYGIIGGGNKEIYMCGGMDYPAYTEPFVQNAYLVRYSMGGATTPTTPPITTTPTTNTTTPTNTTTTPISIPTTTPGIPDATTILPAFSLATLFFGLLALTGAIVLYKRRK